MTFSYTGDPTESDVARLRFILGDTNSYAPIMQDEELQYIVDTYTTEKQRLAVAFRQCANILGAKLVKRSLGPQSEDATKRHDYFSAMADKYERDLSYAGVPPLPDYQSDKVFEKNMMANDT